MEPAAGVSQSPALHIIQIVRRYGPVGGMERYVWELAKELAAADQQVTVLCEQLLADTAPEHIHVVELGVVAAKPRWLAHVRFSARVSDWIAAHGDASCIIHSHERTSAHQFTTFHGPPFASVRDKPWWKRISPRIYANLWLERRELCAAQVRAVIPNSLLISDALLHYYPATRQRLTAPITPGVTGISARKPRSVATNAGIIGFVGKEWRRKGLDIAVEIVAKLRKTRPGLEFMVAGPEMNAVQHLFKDWDGGYQLLGEVDTAPLYAQFDLLLHPARQEPYGMVIAEARAAGVPVVISDACGIQTELDASAVLPLDAAVTDWCHACNAQIGHAVTPTQRSWKTVAAEQLACYRDHAGNAALKSVSRA